MLKFDFITIPSLHIMLGTMGKGKSSAIKSICIEKFQNKEIDFVIAICSSNMAKKYREWIPEEYIYTSYSKALIHSIGYLAETISDRFKGCIIFDDILAYSKEFGTDLLRGFMSQVKNDNLLVFVSLHYINGTKTPLFI